MLTDVPVFRRKTSVAKLLPRDDYLKIWRPRVSFRAGDRYDNHSAPRQGCKGMLQGFLITKLHMMYTCVLTDDRISAIRAVQRPDNMPTKCVICSCNIVAAIPESITELLQILCAVTVCSADACKFE